jgi:mRNA-degrading endonuclease RelE of RelBE toxin-antitoxin system
MKSSTTRQFHKSFQKLPAQVQRRARNAYRLFLQNPYHPSLRFKQVHPTRPIYSARVGQGYRALGQKEENEVIWFWIGSHEDYNKLLSRLA